MYRCEPKWRIRPIIACALLIATALPCGAHPGSGIAIGDDGQVYFAHTGYGLWTIQDETRLEKLEGPGFHFLTIDPAGTFVDQAWPRYREQYSHGDIRYGDAEIRPVGANPTLLCASSFPIVVGHDGALYYPDAGLDERVYIMRMMPGAQPTKHATLPVAMEIDPDGNPIKAMWIYGLAARSNGDLYYAEKESIRRVDTRGVVSTVAESIEVPGCVHNEDHRGGPVLRGLDVADDGTVYVASFACQSVIQIKPDGTLNVVLRAEDPWTPTGIVAKGNSLYVLEFWFGEVEHPKEWRPRVRRISPEGIISLLATVTLDN